MQKVFVLLFCGLTLGTFRASGYEGFLFYVNFFNLTNVLIPNTLTDRFFQEIFISGDEGTTVIINNIKNGSKMVKRFGAKNLTSAIGIEYELGGNNQATYNASIVISSVGGPISVQANKATRDTGDGYLAFPLSTKSTEYLLASYNGLDGLPSLFSVTSLFDGTCIDLEVAYPNGTRSRLNHLSLDANEIFYGSMQDDVTGIHVTSSKPIAVLSGHLCAKVPVGRRDCDHLVEQMVPVGEWGRIHVASSMNGIQWRSGVRVRIVCLVAQNVSVEATKFFQDGRPPGTERATLSVNSFQFAEYFLQDHQFGPVVVVITCPETCMVVQYGVGNPDPLDTTYQTMQDPLMMIVPSIDHYPYNVHFSTSHVYKLPINDAVIITEALNYVTIIAKDAHLGLITFDGSPLPLSDQSTIKVSVTCNSTRYTSVMFAVGHSFHSVTSNSPDVTYAVFVYGFGRRSDNNPTGYGYLGGYRYGSGSSDNSLIKSGPWFDPSPLQGASNVSNGGQNDAIVVTENDLPFQVVVWNASFCTIHPLDNIVRRKCSEGYRNFFLARRVPFVEAKLRSACTNATVSVSLMPLQYSEYTCGQINVLIKVTGINEGTLGSIPACVDAMDGVVSSLSNWMEQGKYRVDKVIDTTDDENIADCAPVHFKSDKFSLQSKGWTCPQNF